MKIDKGIEGEEGRVTATVFYVVAHLSAHKPSKGIKTSDFQSEAAHGRLQSVGRITQIV